MVNKLKITVKQMIMNFQWIARSWTFFIFVGFFCFISFMIPVIFIPIPYSIAIVFTLLLISVNSILFATLNYEFRNSTLRSNMRLSSSGRVTFNLSIYFVMVIISVLASTFLFCILGLLNHFNLLLSGWFKYGYVNEGYKDFKYQFTFDFYTLVVYVSTMMTTIIYAISFFLNYVIKSKVGYFNVLLSLLILTIIFGGGFNTYWYYWGRLDSPIFPNNIYWFSVIFPFYNFGELLRRGLSLTMKASDGSLYSTAVEFYSNNFSMLNTVFISVPLYSSSSWRFLMAVPYIEIVTFVGVGAILSKVQRN